MDERIEAKSDAKIVERVAAPLRKQEVVSEGFASAVMSEVRKQPIHAATRRWWLLEKQEVTVRPLAVLALAASLMMAFIGVAQKADPVAPAPTIAATADTVHVVRFVFIDDGASEVSLVGDFNGWSREATRLEQSAVSGVWVATVPLDAGRYEYAFIVDGERWVVDSTAAVRYGEFETATSVIAVGSSRS